MKAKAFYTFLALMLTVLFSLDGFNDPSRWPVVQKQIMTTWILYVLVLVIDIVLPKLDRR